MIDQLPPFLLHWAITAVALWLATHVFRGMKFANVLSLIASALVLGFVNSILRPVLIFLTLPLTLVTLGFFLLVINALMLRVVAALVPGFKVTGFWTAFFASIFISVFSFVVEVFVASEKVPVIPPTGGTWL